MPQVKVRPCPLTGRPLKRSVRPLTLSYKGRHVTVDMPGWYPSGKGESLHSAADMRVSDRALVELRRMVEEDIVLPPSRIHAIRRKLGLSQREASELIGSGPRSFQKYESGEVEASVPMSNLLRLLENDPARVEELRRIAEHPATRQRRKVA